MLKAVQGGKCQLALTTNGISRHLFAIGSWVIQLQGWVIAITALSTSCIGCFVVWFVTRMPDWLMGCYVGLMVGLLVGANQVLNAVWRLGSTPSTGLFLIYAICQCPAVTGCHNAACVPGWLLAWLGAWLVTWLLACYDPWFDCWCAHQVLKAVWRLGLTPSTGLGL